MLEIKDQIFDNHKIKNKILIDLLNCKTLNRLKKIHQSGASYLVRKGRDGSRYEHSIGVMLLIKILGGTIEEQIAGLLHDISHTAFSHVIDQVFGNKKEDFHDKHQNWFLQNSDILEILKKHKVDSCAIFDSKNWPILEQDQPYLCADRIDYTLRDLYNFKNITKDEAITFLNNLKVIENKIIVKDPSMGLWFAQKYAILVSEFFMSPIEVYSNNHLAKAIRFAIDDGILSKDDMILKTDDEILNVLENKSNSKIKKILHDLDFGLNVVQDLKNFEYNGFSKARYVDPLIIYKNKITTTSLVFPKIKEAYENIIEKSNNGIYVRKK
jgi:HD superfamily phosphohydrolase